MAKIAKDMNLSYFYNSRQKGREKEREGDRERDRQRGRETGREREREREKERESAPSEVKIGIGTDRPNVERTNTMNELFPSEMQ